MERSALFFLTLTACSGDAFFTIPMDDAAVEGGDAGDPAADVKAGSDSSPDVAKLDAPDGCPTQTGQAACESIENSFCTRVATCCAGNACGCNQNPQDWFCSVQTCRAHYVAQGYDCQAFASTLVCADSSQSCASNVQSATCQDLLNANCTKPGLSACVPFWGQF